MSNKNVLDVIKELLHNMEEEDIKELQKTYMEGSLKNGDKVTVGAIIKRV